MSLTVRGRGPRDQRPHADTTGSRYPPPAPSDSARGTSPRRSISFRVISSASLRVISSSRIFMSRIFRIFPVQEYEGIWRAPMPKNQALAQASRWLHGVPLWPENIYPNNRGESRDRSATVNQVSESSVFSSLCCLFSKRECGTRVGLETSASITARVQQGKSSKEKSILRKQLLSLGKLSVIALAVFLGTILGRIRAPQSTVNAQDRFTGIVNCITVVPKSWGEFKGGSSYGLAFQDKDGNVRFVLNPTCGSVNSPAEPPVAPIDLEVERR